MAIFHRSILKHSTIVYIWQTFHIPVCNLNIFATRLQIAGIVLLQLSYLVHFLFKAMNMRDLVYLIVRFGLIDKIGLSGLSVFSQKEGHNQLAQSANIFFLRKQWNDFHGQEIFIFNRTFSCTFYSFIKQQNFNDTN